MITEITNDDELDMAIRRVDQLLDLPIRTRAEEQELEDLSDAIYDYEEDDEPL